MNPKIYAFLEQDALLIDVRSPMEFLMGHIKGSENIPLNRLPNHLEDIKAKNKPVLVFCASGMRSENASQLMNQAGINAVNAGGWSALREEIRRLNN